jgi:uncharacterized protein
LIDNSSLLLYLFYPRRQHGKPPDGAFDLAVPVEKDISIVCRAYPGQAENPWILYFHGNGEVVSDYDGIAYLYNNRGLNLLVADYRGYGASGGKPTFSDMVSDAVKIFDFVYEDEHFHGTTGEPVWFVMGRSLGSISALELAVTFPDRFRGLIIESGFISVAGLIHHLGLPLPGDLSPLEEEYLRLVSRIDLPSLVIHGDQDRLVPLKQGKDVYEALGSKQKELVVIPRADHNNIMFVDSIKYMDAIENFILS